jgi:hypothetical protein
MLLSIALAVVAGLALRLNMSLFSRARPVEMDPQGNPMLRYLAAPYLMATYALVFLAVGVFELFDPLNHMYAGNLLLLCYTPMAIGVFAFCAAVYLYTFKATLYQTALVVRRWPLGCTSFELAALESVDRKGRGEILRFSGNKKFVVYKNYSGRDHVLSALSANSSSKRTREKPRAA